MIAVNRWDEKAITRFGRRPSGEIPIVPQSEAIRPGPGEYDPGN
jgi:hypothetical protein